MTPVKAAYAARTWFVHSGIESFSGVQHEFLSIFLFIVINVEVMLHFIFSEQNKSSWADDNKQYQHIDQGPVPQSSFL